ncbi:MAG: RNA-binding domain-containing protein [Marinifilaceae bacterium]
MKNVESNRIEFKEKLTNELEKEIVAFLNYKEGGFVYVGIDKHSNVVGLKDADDVQLRIKDRLKNNILPSCMGLFDVVKEESEGKSIIKIVVASGSEKPYYVKKNGMSERGCFIRVGSSSEPMQQRIIEDLFAKRTRNSIGRIISNRQDLTFAQLKIYYEAMDRTLNSNFLQNLELLTKDKELNYVAYLMADNNGNSIKLAKYDGLKRVHLLENNEYGYCSLIKATKQVLDKIELENRTFAKITSKERIETRYWDAVALREAVINALVHNDYTGEVPPKFEIFDDRIEITSTGGLPNSLNKEIMRIYKDLDLTFELFGLEVPRILFA